MHIELFDEFVTLAEELNYHTAAERLHTTQSTLSKHIALMEREYGVRLFDRGRSGVVLTSKGAILLESARAIRDEYAASRTLLSEGARRQTLFVSGELDNPGSFELVSQTVGRFSQRNTEYTPHFLPCSSTALDAQLDLLKNGEADCAVFGLDRRALAIRDDAELFRTRLVSSVPVDAMMSAANPLAQSDELKLADLAGSTFVRLVGPRYTPSWKIIERQLRTAGIRYMTTPMAANSPYDFMSMELGSSIVLLPRSTATPGVSSPGGSARVPIAASDLGLALYAVFLQERASQAIEDFINALTETFADAFSSEA